MRIIVEGPDNAGKSTLVRHLASALTIPVVPGEGPGKSYEEINDRVRRYASLDNVIFDRHPCVSQLLYNQFRAGYGIEPELVGEFYLLPNFFIFCRGTGTLEGTKWRDVDQILDQSGARHEDTVKDHHLAISYAYENWALGHAHAIYRMGESYNQLTSIVQMIMQREPFDPVADIAEFHMKFGLEYDGPPRVLPADLSNFRRKFMQEELNEYGEHEGQAAAEWSDKRSPDLANYTHHLEHMLDALVDEVYVVLGTSYLHGFKFREAWRRVHAANMLKVRATHAEQSARGSLFDVVKPAGWEPPSHKDLVEGHDLALAQALAGV